MITTVYHLPIDWRRAAFYLDHPRTIPAATIDDPPFTSRHSYFLPAEQINDVRAIRNWLYKAALTGRYYLLGCYTAVSSVFQGIVVVFDHAADLVLFRTYWQHTYEG